MGQDQVLTKEISSSILESQNSNGISYFSEIITELSPSVIQKFIVGLVLQLYYNFESKNGKKNSSKYSTFEGTILDLFGESIHKTPAVKYTFLHKLLLGYQGIDSTRFLSGILYALKWAHFPKINPNENQQLRTPLWIETLTALASTWSSSHFVTSSLDSQHKYISKSLEISLRVFSGFSRAELIEKHMDILSYLMNGVQVHLGSPNPTKRNRGKYLGKLKFN